MRMTKLSLLFFFIFKFADQRTIYNNLKNNAEERPQTTYFAKKAIKFSILFAVLTIGGAALSMFGLHLISLPRVLSGILLAAFGLIFAINGILFLPLVLNCVIKQLILNHKALGWIALSVFVVLVAVVIFAVIMLATHIV